VTSQPSRARIFAPLALLRADIEASYVVMIPRPLKYLGFDSMTSCLTPFQIALCYGSDSVARLKDKGEISLNLAGTHILLRSLSLLF